MTILKCSATTCAYNEDMLCSRGEINVMGDSAKSSEETSCGSFREKSQGAMNSAKNGCGCETIQIDCKAHNCTYNENCKCTAAAIDVAGSGAKVCSETKCDTFECQCSSVFETGSRTCLKKAFCKNFSNRFQKITANLKTAPAQMCEGLLISIHYLFLKKSGIWISFF